VGLGNRFARVLGLDQVELGAVRGDARHGVGGGLDPIARGLLGSGWTVAGCQAGRGLGGGDGPVLFDIIGDSGLDMAATFKGRILLRNIGYSLSALLNAACSRGGREGLLLIPSHTQAIMSSRSTKFSSAKDWQVLLSVATIQAVQSLIVSLRASVGGLILNWPRVLC
jgi:hypothetical protein